MCGLAVLISRVPVIRASGKNKSTILACPLVRLLCCIRRHISTNMHWRTRLVYEPKYGAILRIYFLPRPLVRYDNESGKGDHKHIESREESFQFKNVETLVADFLKEIQKARKE